ncbi:hypothetical protein [Ferrimonas gelatinilytica]|uniref:Uncharacterized protein n=1 Tax=Ferrimonas gelatinilytica TaxID=1255257 RepID=A0ABP9S931_9GAMM
MEGHSITGCSDGHNKPETPIELKPEAAQEARSYLEHHADTKQRFERVAQLIEGFESQGGMELLSTVYWVATPESEGVLSPSDLVGKVHSWSPHKAEMKPTHIVAAWERR